MKLNMWIYAIIFNLMYLIIYVEEYIEKKTGIDYIVWRTCEGTSIPLTYAFITILLGFYLVSYSQDESELIKNMRYGIMIIFLSLIFWYFVFKLVW